MLNNRTLNSTLDRIVTLNRALDEAFSAGWTQNQIWVPAIDVVETKEAYVLYAELPAVDPSEMDVNFEKGVLTVRGTKRPAFDAAKNGEHRIYAAERVTGAFERSIRLPEFVDGDKIAAEFSHGLLTVTVPKAQAAQPRRIQINVGEPKHAEVSNGRPAEVSAN
jgi:HSP20 family protein